MTMTIAVPPKTPREFTQMVYDAIADVLGDCYMAGALDDEVFRVVTNELHDQAHRIAAKIAPVVDGYAASQFRMPYGKYEGRRLSEIPLAYFRDARAFEGDAGDLIRKYVASALYERRVISEAEEKYGH